MRNIAIIGIFLIACSGGGMIPQPIPDAYAPDASMLMDAQILEKLASDTVGSYWDTSLTDAVVLQDTSEPDIFISNYDTIDNDTIADVTADTMAVDTGYSSCGNCADGYVCQNNKCVFAAQCDTNGLVDINSLNTLMDGTFIKLQGLIQIGKSTCSNQVCNKDNPCCQDCFASLKLGPITLKGDGISIGCLGTNCDFRENCTPLTPKQNYIVWGKLGISGFDLELIVQGYCAGQ